jgi:hypothetical protein
MLITYGKQRGPRHAIRCELGLADEKREGETTGDQATSREHPRAHEVHAVHLARQSNPANRNQQRKRPRSGDEGAGGECTMKTSKKKTVPLRVVANRAVYKNYGSKNDETACSD